MYIIIDRKYSEVALCDSYEVRFCLYGKNLLIIKGGEGFKKGEYFKQTYFGLAKNCTILKVNPKIAKILYAKS